ncbi:MAG: hypothetical protein QNJ81_01655 [Acidimicrobiia bacterium]|nr:hypothetical protein [Acidimicrobiia bacterium]
MAVVLALLVVPTSAAAEDVTVAEAVDLVDQRRMADLAAVTSIDGRPVDMDVVLGDETDDSLERLDSLRLILLEPESGPELDSASLRSEAEDITSNPPYAAGIAQGGGILGRVLDFLGQIFGNTAAQGIAIVVVIAIALAVAIPLLNRLAMRRERPVAEAGAETHAEDYGAAALTAESRGEHGQAVRLLFLDGAQHLQGSGIVKDAATTSTATVRKMADDDAFLDRFDEIAYGGSTADEGDVAQARSGWQRLKQRRAAR